MLQLWTAHAQECKKPKTISVQVGFSYNSINPDERTFGPLSETGLETDFESMKNIDRIMWDPADQIRITDLDFHKFKNDKVTSEKLSKSGFLKHLKDRISTSRASHPDAEIVFNYSGHGGPCACDRTLNSCRIQKKDNPNIEPGEILEWCMVLPDPQLGLKISKIVTAGGRGPEIDDPIYSTALIPFTLLKQTIGSTRHMNLDTCFSGMTCTLDIENKDQTSIFASSGENQLSVAFSFGGALFSSLKSVLQNPKRLCTFMGVGQENLSESDLGSAVLLDFLSCEAAMKKKKNLPSSVSKKSLLDWAKAGNAMSSSENRSVQPVNKYTQVPNFKTLDRCIMSRKELGCPSLKRGEESCSRLLSDLRGKQDYIKAKFLVPIEKIECEWGAASSPSGRSAEIVKATRSGYDLRNIKHSLTLLEALREKDKAQIEFACKTKNNRNPSVEFNGYEDMTSALKAISAE